MRNPARIRELMELVTLYWEKYPDTRFNQLIESLQWDYANENGFSYKKELYEKEEWKNIVSYRPLNVTDLFYVEDDKFIEFLKKKLDQSQK